MSALVAVAVLLAIELIAVGIVARCLSQFDEHHPTDQETP